MPSDTHALFEHQLTDVAEIASGRFVVRFARQFEFAAGQVVAVALHRASVPRLYSICSGETDDEMQLLFDVRDGGDLTPRLAVSHKGDAIWVSEPYGSFLPFGDTPMWWIATGTGIAPYHSMMRSGYRAARLLHGARGVDHFYFENEFRAAYGARYIRCCSSSGEAGDFSGRVTAYLNSLETLPMNAMYYLCGQSLMVVESRDLLIAKGVPFENIISEIYF